MYKKFLALITAIALVGAIAVLATEIQSAQAAPKVYCYTYTYPNDPTPQYYCFANKKDCIAQEHFYRQYFNTTPCEAQR